MSHGLLVAKSECRQCLFTQNRIVSAERRRQVIETCLRNNTHFQCHKGTLRDEDICCRKFYDELGDRVTHVRFARMFDIVTFVEVEDADVEGYCEPSQDDQLGVRQQDK